jgi:hypothetical protein
MAAVAIIPDPRKSQTYEPTRSWMIPPAWDPNPMPMQELKKMLP